MSGRALIIVVTGIIITTSIILYNIGTSSTKIVQNLNDYYSHQSARNIAQSGVNLAIRRLVNDYTYRATTPWTVDMLGGRASILVTNATFDTFKVNTVRIYSIGIEDPGTTLQRSDTSIAYAWVPPIVVPTWTKALVNLNGRNTATGNIEIDGRDHDPWNTAVNAGQGNYGIWTTADTFYQAGSSTVGGTVPGTPGTDFAPAHPADPSIIALNQTYPGGAAPATPDSVFGYGEGTLKALAKTGFGGSQYVTDPSRLTQPFKGITYVELPTSGPASTWSPSGSVKGSGILIVHNSAHNATINNLNGDAPTYGFSGIMVTDDATHINIDFWGALVILTPNPQGNAFGTGQAHLRYSRRAMQNAIGVVQNGSQTKIIAWYEP
ncbi:MAG TPA: hypothetical protein VL633_00570 [Bacteroidota bacterium]|jgi:hypothetical protein|nr:hypothetical protein [Bacteroidota bacterium]